MSTCTTKEKTTNLNHFLKQTQPIQGHVFNLTYRYILGLEITENKTILTKINQELLLNKQPLVSSS